MTTVRALVASQGLDQPLRVQLTGLLERPGNVWAWLARRTDGASAEHVIASLWDPGDVYDPAAVDTAIAKLRADPADTDLEVTSEVLPVSIAVEFPRDRPMTILRVYRGRTHPGEREAYLFEARAGATADGERPDGPGGLACGTRGEDGFVTASVWPDWQSIEACTGGDIHRPLSTRNAIRLADGAPTHYEIVQSTPSPLL